MNTDTALEVRKFRLTDICMGKTNEQVLKQMKMDYNTAFLHNTMNSQ